VISKAMIWARSLVQGVEYMLGGPGFYPQYLKKRKPKILFYTRKASL
jgi:hypothetical protein